MFDIEYFRWPIFSADTAARIAEMVRDGNVSRDDILTESLEQELADYFGVKHALLVNSGTAAAYSAFCVAGVGAGDEVISPPYSHWATILPATLLGCKIVFTDVAADSLNPSPANIERAITPATKAVVVCHLYGNPVDIAAIRAICDERGLLLIEDVSHAVGASVSGRRTGSFGDIAFFSMQASKVLAAGEGGCMLTDSYDFHAGAVELGHSKRIKKLAPQWRRYVHSGRGFKFRLSALHAMLARESLRGLNDQLLLRKEMCARFEAALADTPCVRFPRRVTGADRVFWEQELILHTRTIDTADFREAMRRQGVNAFEPNFPLIADLPQLEMERVAKEALPLIRTVLDRLVILPTLKRRNEALVDRYAQAVQAAVAGAEPLP